MKLIQRLAVTATGVVLSFTAIDANPAQAFTFKEVGDAGQSLTTAIDVGADVNAIQGTINTAQDVDLYRLNLTSGLFVATTVRGVTNNLDTMLWLFDSTGKGIVGNDDYSQTTSQSTISANLTAGTYYLGLSDYDIEPKSAAGFIFNYPNGSKITKLLQPTGPGGAAPITNWGIGLNGISPQVTGQYRILINQATVSTQPVPEPNVPFGLAIFGLSSLLLKKKVASCQKA